MGRWLSSLHTMLAELRRRNVFRVALAYGLVAWFLIQVAATTFPALGLPPWSVTLVIAIVALGFPVALVLAWAYEITPQGVVREAQAAVTPAEGQAPTRSGRPADVEAPSTSPPLETVTDAPYSDAARLPFQPTPFLGREQELHELRRLLRAPGTPLITIVGPGGVGKTRLAIRLAEEEGESFAHGICFVPLAHVTSADALLPSIAQHLRLASDGRRDPKLALLHYLSEKQLLLLLDNFEQVIDGSPLLAELSEAAPGVKMVVTSRERLNLNSEALYPIQGLRFPEGGHVSTADAYEAVQLFVQTARRIDPRFVASPAELASIGRICRLVEGLPLAIELSAAWIGAISCAEIEAEIQRSLDFLVTTVRDVPERHRSLRAVFESSWQMLSEPERKVYRRLSAFRGSFSRDAAERVAQATIPILSSLLNSSLLRRTRTGRYETLEVLRQYAEQKLSEDSAEWQWTAQLHLRYYGEFLAQVSPQLESDAGKATMDRIEEEIDNVRQAWRVALYQHDAAAVQQMMGALFTFYDARAWVQDGEQAFGAATATLCRNRSASTVPAGPELLCSQLAIRHGVFCFHLGLYLKAKELIQREIEPLRRAGERGELAFALHRLGQVSYMLGDYGEARQLNEESLRLYRELNVSKGAARTLLTLGHVAYAAGDYGEARRLYSESYTTLRELGDEAGSAFTLMNLGILAGVEKNFAEATRLLTESLAAGRATANPRLVANSLHNLGCVTFRAGDPTQAERHLREGISICRDMGLRRLLAFCLHELAQVLASRERFDEAQDLRLQALSVAHQINEAPTVLEILVGIASQFVQQKVETRSAAELLALVMHHSASDQHTKDSAADLLRQIEAALGTATLRTAREAGRSVALDDVVQRILSTRTLIPLSIGN